MFSADALVETVSIDAIAFCFCVAVVSVVVVVAAARAVPVVRQLGTANLITDDRCEGRGCGSAIGGACTGAGTCIGALVCTLKLCVCASSVDE